MAMSLLYILLPSNNILKKKKKISRKTFKMTLTWPSFKNINDSTSYHEFLLSLRIRGGHCALRLVVRAWGYHGQLREGTVVGWARVQVFYEFEHILRHFLYHILKQKKKKIRVSHGFLYYTRTDFTPFATLKIRPNYFNVLWISNKKNYEWILNKFWPFLRVGQRHKISPCII